MFGKSALSSAAETGPAQATTTAKTLPLASTSAPMVAMAPPVSLMVPVLATALILTFVTTL